MEIYTVSLFGHRDIDDLRDVENRLMPIVSGLIKNKSYVAFLIGRNGEFDEYGASVIKRAQKENGKENNDRTLVLPYRVADVEYYEKYYDNIIIPEDVHGAHHKAAITLKNRWMVEMSDLVIVYVKREYGGAFNAMECRAARKKRYQSLCFERLIKLFYFRSARTS